MKASKFTDAQKAFIIRQGEDGIPVAEICRKAGISQATYFNWKKKYAGLMPSEMKRLRELEEENSRLKRIVADLTLDREMLQDAAAFREIETGLFVLERTTHAYGGMGQSGKREADAVSKSMEAVRDCLDIGYRGGGGAGHGIGHCVNVVLSPRASAVHDVCWRTAQFRLGRWFGDDPQHRYRGRCHIY
jgi:putative transposase